jgi:hypothetical protein
MISRVRAGFVGAFLDKVFEGVEELGRVEGGCERRGRHGAGAGVARGFSTCAGDTSEWSFAAAFMCVVIGVWISGGSDEGGSEPKPGFNGVRNGDWKGLESVFALSFSRRRFACGVDMLGRALSFVLYRKLATRLCGVGESW